MSQDRQPSGGQGGDRVISDPQAPRSARPDRGPRPGRVLEQRRLDLARSVSRRPDHGDQRGALGRGRVGRPELSGRPGPAVGLDHAAGRGRDVPGPALRQLVPDVQRRLLERPDRLPGERLRRRHQGDHPADRRLRRLGRGDEGRGDRGPAVGHEDAPLPDRPRRGRRDLQPAGRRPKLQLDSAEHRRDLPGHDHEVERPGDRGHQRGRDACRTSIMVVHRSDGSGTTNTFTTYLDTVEPDLAIERRRGQGSQVADRRSARRATTAWPPAVKQTPTARSATSSCSTRRATKLTSAYVKNANGKFVARLDRRASRPRPRPPWPTSRPTSARRRSSTARARTPTPSPRTPTCSSTRTRRTRQGPGPRRVPRTGR